MTPTPTKDGKTTIEAFEELDKELRNLGRVLFESFEPLLLGIIKWLNPLIPKWVGKLPDVNPWNVLVNGALFLWGLQLGGSIAYLIHFS